MLTTYAILCTLLGLLCIFITLEQRSPKTNMRFNDLQRSGQNIKFFIYLIFISYFYLIGTVCTKQFEYNKNNEVSNAVTL